MSLEGIVTAIEQVAKRTRQAPDLFSFCLGGTLVAIALAWLAAKGRAKEVNSATLIGSMVDFADMRDWSAFVHEGHLGALEDHLEAQGFIDSARAPAAVRGDARQRPDLVVGGEALSARPAGAAIGPALPGSRTARASRRRSSNPTIAICCSTTRLKEPAGFKVGDVAIDLAAIKTPMLVDRA